MSVVLALTLDWIFGEPPAWLHPVVAMGRYLKWAGTGLTKRAPGRAFFAGAVAWLLGACVVVTLALLTVNDSDICHGGRGCLCWRYSSNRCSHFACCSAK